MFELMFMAMAKIKVFLAESQGLDHGIVSNTAQRNDHTAFRQAAQFPL